MSEKREKSPSFVSPKGTAKYPRLNEVDYGTDEYPIDGGQYSVKLVMSKEQAQPLIDQLELLHKEAVAKGKAADKKRKPQLKKKAAFNVNDFYSPVYDEDDNETDDVEFSFKMKASGKNKKTQKEWKRRPGLFDANKKPIDPKKVSIWGGSTVKVAFETSPYFIAATGAAGLGLYLKAVQVIDLVTAGQQSAESCGFDVEEGGFNVEDAPDSDDEDSDAYDESEDEEIDANDDDGESNGDF